MDKINELTKEQKDEEKLLIAKVLDKIKFVESRNRFENTDFLDLSQQQIIKEILQKRKNTNYIFYGGYEQAERTSLIIYPQELENTQKIYDQIFSLIRITLPKELWGTYEHKTYLGALMKLGIKREKVGDIIVRHDGADIISIKDIEKFLNNSIQGLTRFQKAKLEVLPLSELKYIEPETKTLKINVPSMRLDAIVGELARCSRSDATILLNQERVFVNFKEELRGTRIIEEETFITIRGKGRFKISKIIGNSKSGRINVEVITNTK